MYVYIYISIIQLTGLKCFNIFWYILDKELFQVQESECIKIPPALVGKALKPKARTIFSRASPERASSDNNLPSCQTCAVLNETVNHGGYMHQVPHSRGMVGIPQNEQTPSPSSISCPQKRHSWCLSERQTSFWVGTVHLGSTRLVSVFALGHPNDTGSQRLHQFRHRQSNLYKPQSSHLVRFVKYPYHTIQSSHIHLRLFVEFGRPREDWHSGPRDQLVFWAPNHCLAEQTPLKHINRGHYLKVRKHLKRSTK